MLSHSPNRSTSPESPSSISPELSALRHADSEFNSQQQTIALENTSFQSGTPNSSSAIKQSLLLDRLIETFGPDADVVKKASLIIAKTDYKITDLIAEGGEAFIFTVCGEQGSEYILKCFKDPPSQTLFCPEAQIGSYLREVEIPDQMNHPRIPKAVSTFRIESEYGAPVVGILRPKIQGHSLKECISQGKYQDPDQLLALLQEVTGILCYLHNHVDNRTGKKIIHSDIKPGNIIIENNGLPTLIDFSSARQIVPGQTFQHTVDLRGSLDYCPEEQITGGGIPASDIYSLGITAIECLLGFLPQELKDNWKRSEPYRIPPDIQISKKFREIIEKMIHPDKEKRYQNASELKEVLENPHLRVIQNSTTWWSRLVASWKNGEVEPTPAMTNQKDSLAAEVQIPQFEIRSRELNEWGQRISLETSQGLYKSFSGNIHTRMRQLVGQGQYQRISTPLRPDFETLPISQLSPSELAQRIPELSKPKQLESALVALSRYTVSYPTYSRTFDLLREHMINLGEAVNYNSVSQHLRLLSRGQPEVLPHDANSPDKKLKSREIDDPKRENFVEFTKLARLINFIERLETKAFGEEFINSFIIDLLSTPHFTLIKLEQEGKVIPFEPSTVDTRAILCGAVTSLLETRKIENGSIDMKVAELLSRHLHTISGRVPERIALKFKRVP